MEYLENIREFLTSYLEMKGRAWWVEVVTQEPNVSITFGLLQVATKLNCIQAITLKI
jgi:hypothetical protein